MKETKYSDKKISCPCRDVCPQTEVLKVIGGKWKIPILCVLSQYEQIRYNELSRMVAGITNTMLASSLKELEASDMVIRVQYPEIPVRVEYSLTEKGRSVLPILSQLKKWGLENLQLFKL